MPEPPEPSARWANIERLFHSAMSRPREERGSYLKAACGGDAELMREVESLVGQEAGIDSLLEHGAAGRHGLLSPEYAPGTMIGPYRVEEAIGAGGMGEVYRAHDPRMGRDVAIKVAGARFSDRFSSEVRAVAALNHPNICQIYDVGPNYFVMELCEGETLAERLTRGEISYSEAVEYGIQIAGALSAAQARGVVHRDLKPANIMLTGSGVKLLDFGLAKRMAPSTGGDLPGIAGPVATEAGAIIGTAAYMSPEQAEGKPVDARTDVFSFGAVLYEMVSGRRAFRGESSAATLSAVLNEEPAPLDDAIPRDLGKLIARCLRKRAESRPRNMSDIKEVLEDLRNETTPERATPARLPAQGMRARRILWPALAALSAFAFGGAFVYLHLADKPDASAKVAHLTSYAGQEISPSFSPDGSQVAFSWNGEKQDNFDIYVKLVSGGPPLRLTSHAQRDHSPAWSPAGDQIAFIRDGFLYLISPLGGPERKLTKASISLSWSPDGKYIAFSDWGPDSSPPSIYVVSVATGERRRVTDPKVGMYGGDRFCAYSPDGKSLAVLRHLTWMGEIFVLPLANHVPSGQPRILTNGSVIPMGLAWTPDGKEVVYSSNRGGRTALWRLSVSPGAEPRRIPGTEEGTQVTISRGPSPRLAYMRFDFNWNIWHASITEKGNIAAVPRPLIVSTGVQTDPRFSPDGKRIVFSSDRSDNRELWVAESTGANPVQLTNFAGARTAGAPRWSPDSSQIAFDSTDGRSWDIYVIDAGGGAPRRLTDSTAQVVRPSWSRDGRWIYYGIDKTRGAAQIWKIPVEGGKAEQVTQGGGIEAFESPDGKTLYFAKGYSSPGILSMPVHGGDETVVIPNARPGYWDVADNGILFLDTGSRTGTGPAALRYYNFGTRQTSQIGSIEKITVSQYNTFSATRDGRQAIWCQLDRAESDLLMVENFR